MRCPGQSQRRTAASWQSEETSASSAAWGWGCGSPALQPRTAGRDTPCPETTQFSLLGVPHSRPAGCHSRQRRRLRPSAAAQPAAGAGQCATQPTTPQPAAAQPAPAAAQPQPAHPVRVRLPACTAAEPGPTATGNEGGTSDSAHNAAVLACSWASWCPCSRPTISNHGAVAVCLAGCRQAGLGPLEHQHQL